MSISYETQFDSIISLGEMIQMIPGRAYLVEFDGYGIINKVKYNPYEKCTIEKSDYQSRIGIAVEDEVIYEWRGDMWFTGSFSLEPMEKKYTESRIILDRKEIIEVTKESLLKSLLDEVVDDRGLKEDDIKFNIKYYKEPLKNKRGFKDTGSRGCIKLKAELEIREENDE